MNEKAFIEQYPHAHKPDILLGGPPCQGATQMPTIALGGRTQKQVKFDNREAAIVLELKW